MIKITAVILGKHTKDEGWQLENNCHPFVVYEKLESRWKNAQIAMRILGKFILIENIDIEVVRPYTKKTAHYNM